MNPVSWTKKRGFYMSKLSYEDKINLYEDKNKEYQQNHCQKSIK